MPIISSAAKISSIYANSLPFLAGAFGIGVALAALQYMFSRIINDASLKSRAAESLSNVVDTAFLIGGFLFLVWATSFAISSMAGVPYSETVHLELARISMEKFVSTVESSYLSLYISDAVMSVFFGLHIPLVIRNDSTEAAQVAIQPLVSLHALFGYVSTLLNVIVINFLGVMARLYLVKLVPYIITFLLPLAVMFRSLNFTRSLGSALFALIITIYYVYPLSVVFTDYLLFEKFTPIVFQKNSLLLTSHVEDLSIPGYSSNDDFRRAAADYYEFATNPEVANIVKADRPLESLEEFAGSGTLWTMTSSKFAEILKKSLFTAGGFVAGSAVSTAEKIVDNVPIAGKWMRVALVATKYMISGFILYQISPIDMVLTFFDLLVTLMYAIAFSSVLLLLALVLEILISITAYKQLAEVLGGEALLFGLTKVM